MSTSSSQPGTGGANPRPAGLQMKIADYRVPDRARDTLLLRSRAGSR
jgi:hypothetical protein